MKDGPDIAFVASMIGDPARANMLLGLMDGGSLSAGELAEEAGLALSTTSWHLGKLQEAGLIVGRKDGRSKFFSIADARVAGLLEQLMIVSGHLGHTRQRPSSKAAQIKDCRVCYDHLAGTKGVWFYQEMRKRQYLVGGDEWLRLTQKGQEFSASLGVNFDKLDVSQRPVCMPCLDWSEGSYHLGGALGAAYLDRFVELNWVKRASTGRGLTVSPKGDVALRQLFPRQA